MINGTFRIFPSAAFKYCAAGFLVLLAQAASASGLGEKARQCEAIRKATYEDTVVAQMDCFNQEMDLIRRDKLDLDELGEVIVSIRGRVQEGTEREHSCSSYVVFNEVKTVHPLVRGGTCSDFWNENVHNLNEFYRLTCHVGFGELDETVKEHKQAAARAAQDYDDCFTNSIPQRIRDDYLIGSREELANKYNMIKQKYEESKNSIEYGDLALSCDELLKEVQQKDPKLILYRNLRCN